jgi:hypothetical protein
MIFAATPLIIDVFAAITPPRRFQRFSAARRHASFAAFAMPPPFSLFAMPCFVAAAPC